MKITYDELGRVSEVKFDEGENPTEGFKFAENVVKDYNAKMLEGNKYIADKNVEMARFNGKKVIIGDKTWIGMNSLILPGVVLGPNTVVGGGSVVTKSFPDGHCVIAGNPAKLIKNING